MGLVLIVQAITVDAFSPIYTIFMPPCLLQSGLGGQRFAVAG